MRLDSMKNMPSIKSGRQRAAAALVALGIVAALVSSGVAPVVADSKSRPAARGLSEDQRIVHLLNRLGFGARPGDVERVKRMGIDKYIDQQLHPERIDDAAAEARLAGFESLRMTIAEIMEKYPQPNEVARTLGLGRKGANQQLKPNDTAAPGVGALPDPLAGDGQSKEDQREYRQKIFAYYRENGLKPPQQLLQELQAQKIIRGVYSERQLQEVMADFWFNHFNIFFNKGADKWLTTNYEMQAIRPNALGKFKDIVEATAKSPAMLFYLDNFQSSSPDARMPERRRMGQGGRFQGGRLQRRPGLLGGAADPRIEGRGQAEREMERDQMADQQRRERLAQQLRKRKPGINENYARELMELHTLGVEGGYTQKDVQEVARCFTGWSIDQPRRSGRFVFREWMHDNGEKVVLGHKIPAGGGIKDGQMVIEILSRHPNTAKFISTKLARRFVSDNPPQALVDRVAAVYMKTDGDTREMLRAIFTSPEFNSAEAYRAKIKSPFELAVSAIRALGGETVNAQQVAQFIARMGQPLYQYQPPTGYPDRATQWVNTGSLLERLNFGLALSANRLRGTSVDVKRAAGNVAPADTGRVMDRAIAVLLNGDVSAETRRILDKQLKEGVPVKGELERDGVAMNRDETAAADQMSGDAARPADGAPRGRRAGGRAMDYELRQAALSPDDEQLARVFGLVLGSPEFQRK